MSSKSKSFQASDQLWQTCASHGEIFSQWKELKKKPHFNSVNFKRVCFSLNFCNRRNKERRGRQNKAKNGGKIINLKERERRKKKVKGEKDDKNKEKTSTDLKERAKGGEREDKENKEKNINRSKRKCKGRRKRRRGKQRRKKQQI